MGADQRRPPIYGVEEILNRCANYSVSWQFANLITRDALIQWPIQGSCSHACTRRTTGATLWSISSPCWSSSCRNCRNSTESAYLGSTNIERDLGCWHQVGDEVICDLWTPAHLLIASLLNYSSRRPIADGWSNGGQKVGKICTYSWWWGFNLYHGLAIEWTIWGRISTICSNIICCEEDTSTTYHHFNHQFHFVVTKWRPIIPPCPMIIILLWNITQFTYKTKMALIN